MEKQWRILLLYYYLLTLRYFEDCLAVSLLFISRHPYRKSNNMNDHPPQHVGFQERWVRFGPTEAPKTWLGINIICCTYSVMLGWILALVSDDGDPREMLLAKHSYLIYDWLLCTIWVVEVGLTLMQYNLAALRIRGGEKKKKKKSQALFLSWVSKLPFRGISW